MREEQAGAGKGRGDEPLDLFGAEHTRRLDATGWTLDTDEQRLDVLPE